MLPSSLILRSTWQIGVLQSGQRGETGIGLAGRSPGHEPLQKQLAALLDGMLRLRVVPVVHVIRIAVYQVEIDPWKVLPGMPDISPAVAHAGPCHSHTLD